MERGQDLVNIRERGFQGEMSAAKDLRWEWAGMFEEQQQVAWLEQPEDRKREQMQLEQGVQRVEVGCSVAKSCLNSLQPHGPQHARPPCPSPSPRAFSNSCPLSWWCHPTISSSFGPFCSFLSLFQHQNLFLWTGSLHQMAKVLDICLQHQSFQWIFRVDLL